MVEWLQDEHCVVALDTQHHPVVISSWTGVLSVEIVDAYFRWSDATAAAALAAEQRLLHIVNLDELEWSRQGVRKRALEHVSLNLADEVMLSTIVVCGDCAERTRGFMGSLALLRRSRHAREVLIVETVAEAIGLALERMWNARIPPPFGLEPGCYQTPRLDLMG